MTVTVAECTGPPRKAPSMADADLDQETTRLVLQARAGDAEAFGALVTLHRRAARRVALVALGNPAEADEAVQEACLVAWRKVARLEDPEAFRAWLLQITWRKALDRRRSLSAWVRRLRNEWPEGESPVDGAAEPGQGPDRQLLARERDRVVARCIRSLPGRLRDPFLLAAGGAHRYEEIGALLGLPLGTVKWRVSEARRVIREKLTRLGFGDAW